MSSKFNEEVTVEGIKYNFQLLGLKDAMKIESKVIGLIGSVMGKTVMDEDTLYDIGIKVCNGLLVDDFEVKSLDDHFKGKALLFNKVLLAGLRVNFPDFFLGINKLDSNSAIKKALSDTGLNL